MNLLQIPKQPRREEGSGNIIGQDGSVIFVHHSGTLVCMNQSRLRKVREKKELEKIKAKEATEGNESLTTNDPQKQENINTSNEKVTQNIYVESTTTALNMDLENETVESDEISNESSVDLRRLMLGQLILYDHMEGGTRISARIIHKAGKAKGRNKNWYNIECIEPKECERQKILVYLTRVNGFVFSIT